jgi:hypothetical protein
MDWWHAMFTPINGFKGGNCLNPNLHVKGFSMGFIGDQDVRATPGWKAAIKNLTYDRKDSEDR